MARRTAGSRPNILGGLAGWIWLAIVILPVYAIVVTSLRPQSDYYSENPLSWPSNPSIDAYTRVLQNDFLRYFGNSVIVTAASVVVILAVSLMASYVVVRSRRRSTGRLFQVFLLGIAIPIQATIIPVYYLIVKLGLYDTLWALILPSIAFAIPLSVLILTNFLRDVPGELFESMRMDGAGEWRTLWDLAIPLTRPAIVTVGVYNALQVWNGFLFPLVLTQSSETRVLPLSLWSFQGAFSVDIPAVLAAVVLSVLPILAAYILGRRQLVSGLTAGFGK
ncbi:carbohydrate ABC transporter permease [Cellulomonas denverensis]|uniref:Carbohydrate ABC transporter permease n=1 Tax=Cellulomonas denverensis TaxID=264297 RepID=A0A7X6KSJ0_9CELL|nr:carbohydrate ABC transporter permease [Cellulomonas denverensis]NKY21486.1 carbohydrate ABC transporter permease [Cellulomonas denverensis]GIG26998.1 ABC transporter permease [Cellulomonas denverensis]